MASSMGLLTADPVLLSASFLSEYSLALQGNHEDWPLVHVLDLKDASCMYPRGGGTPRLSTAAPQWICGSLSGRVLRPHDGHTPGGIMPLTEGGT